MVGKTPEEEQELVDRINARLAKVALPAPSIIRVLDLFAVTKSFNGKNSCGSRQYEYLLPTFVFSPKLNRSHAEFDKEVFGRASSREEEEEEEEDTKGKGKEEEEEETKDIGIGVNAAAAAAASSSASSTNTAASAAAGAAGDNAHEEAPPAYREIGSPASDFRLGNEELEQLRQALLAYKGTHNYHNL